MVYVYAITSIADGRIYIGQTINLEKRIKEHNSGVTRSTRNYRPWKLVYTEEAIDRMAARVREKYLKSGCGKELIKKHCACSSIG